MFVSEIYSKVINLFQDQSRWTQGYYHRDKAGKECTWREGHSFCVLGGLGHFTWPYDLNSNEAQCCLQRVAEHLFGNKEMGSASIQTINDQPDGYKKVMHALKFTKDLWEGKEPTSDELAMPVESLPWFEEFKNKHEIKS